MINQEFEFIPVIFRSNGRIVSGECPDYPGAKSLIKKMAKRDGCCFNMYEEKGRIFFSFEFIENINYPKGGDVSK